MSQMVDVAIVGQGLAGTTLAWRLRSRGEKVLVLDDDRPSTASRCAPAPPSPSELSLVPLLRIPCPAMPTQTPFLIDSASADHSSLLCILIGSQLTSVSLPSPSSSQSPAIEFTHPAISAAPVRWKGNTSLLLLSTPSSLTLLHKGTPIALLSPPSLTLSSIRRLTDAAGPRLTLVSDSSAERIEIRKVFASGLARDVAATLERAVPLSTVGTLLFVAASPPDAQPEVEWKHLSSALNAALLPAPPSPAPASTDDWTALLQSSAHANPLNVSATRHLSCPTISLGHSPAANISVTLLPPVVAELRARAGQIVSALHTLYETLKLDSRRAAALSTLGHFLAPLSAALGMPVYADLIRRDLAIPLSPLGPLLANAPPPFSLLSWLIACLIRAISVIPL